MKLIFIDKYDEHKKGRKILLTCHVIKMVGMSFSKNDSNTMQERWLKCHYKNLNKETFLQNIPIKTKRKMAGI